jgi:hypothetical protein
MAYRITALLLAAVLLPSWLQAADRDMDLEDALRTLKAKGQANDGPALLDFFRKHTLSDADRAQLAETARRLGAPAFAVREKASRDLLKAGGPALPILRAAVVDPDLEISHRAERCLAAIE